LSNLAKDPFGIYAIILEPTRELAFQVVEQLKIFSSGFFLRYSMIIGGEDITNQLISIEKIPHIIVATPGRLLYLLKECSFNFKCIKNLRYLILDEFDQLLNDSIAGDIKRIIDLLPKNDHQTLFFSATINYNIHNDLFFQQFCLKKPILIDLINKDLQEKTVQELIQNFILVPNKVKEIYLYDLLSNDFKNKYIIIFVNNCLKCYYLTSLLKLLGFKVSMINSKIPQKIRFKAIEDFKAKNHNILISTDLASRGLDIPLVDLVVNYDIPRNPDDYIHRVGRTARAGNFGSALSLITQYDVCLILEIEKRIGKKLSEFTVNDEEVIKNLNLISSAGKMVKLKMYENGIEEKIKKRKEKYNISRKNQKQLNKDV